MFDFVAKHKRLLQLVLTLLIVPSFAMWGISSYQQMSGGVGDIAVVSGQKISEQEFSSQLQSQLQRIRTLTGGAIDASVLDNPQARANILEGIIQQRLLTLYVVKNRLAVTPEELRDLIASNPAFQDNGKFSRALYEGALRSEGYTPAQFEGGLQNDLLVQQLVSAVSDSGLVSRAVARQWALIAGEQREVATARLGTSPFTARVKITPEAEQAYYDANRASFEVPEQVNIEYVVLNADVLAANEQIPEADIKSQYAARRAQFEQKEERRASHILVTARPDASAADKAKAKTKAEALVAELKKGPGRFADLAKKNSEDPGSAGKGGDLGFFSRGMMTKPFEDAVFGMTKPGEIAGPVPTDFGYHIIQLAAIKPATVRPYEEARAEIERDLRKQRAGRRFGEAAESFSNVVYEQPDSLKPAADKFKLQIQQGGWVVRTGAKVATLNNKRLLSALFSDDAINGHHNTEAIEVSPGTLLAARVLEHKPRKVPTLDEVRAEVGKQIVQKEAASLAWKQGAQALEQLKKGQGTQLAFGAPKVLGREGASDLPPQAVAAAFRVNAERPPAYAGVELPDGYLVVRVSRVIAPGLDETKEKGAQAELGRIEGSRQFKDFVADLRAGAKVVINKELLEKKTQ
jgi:peptidyl-prolyl cis-trans isomerase D